MSDKCGARSPRGGGGKERRRRARRRRTRWRLKMNGKMHINIDLVKGLWSKLLVIRYRSVFKYIIAWNIWACMQEVIC